MFGCPASAHCQNLTRDGETHIGLNAPTAIEIKLKSKFKRLGAVARGPEGPVRIHAEEERKDGDGGNRGLGMGGDNDPTVWITTGDLGGGF